MNGKSLMGRNGFAIGIIILLLGTCLIPTTAQNTNTAQSSRGDWLYVGGEGPGNYTTIQDAVDAATDGDTVFVYSGFYYSTVNIRKSINLKGENKTNTIIDANGETTGVALVKGKINISGFTIRHAILAGLFISDGTHNVSDNIIKLNDAGIVLWGGTNCIIYKNIIKLNNGSGIENQFSQNTWCTQNIFMNNSIGFYNEGPYQQIVEKNSFEGNTEGIEYQLNSQNKIISNNFLQNKIDTKRISPGFNLLYDFQDFLGFLLRAHGSKWDANYWDTWHKTTPKPIGGFFIIYIEFLISQNRAIFIPLGIYPSFKFDRHPAQEPYIIGG